MENALRIGLFQDSGNFDGKHQITCQTVNSVEMQVRDFIWSYKITIFFLLTYWILDPILYWHFGNAYISQSPNENKLLVFLAGPFSFSEDFQVNTPFYQALTDAALNGNFWIPLFTIWLVEWKIQDNFHIGDFKVNIWKSYSISVAASYMNAAYNWTLTSPHSPPPGTSIIAFSVMMTYFVFYPLVAYLIQRQDKPNEDPSIGNALFVSFAAFTFILLWQFYLTNGAGPLHLMGLAFYVAIYFFIALKSIRKIDVERYDRPILRCLTKK